MNRRLLTVTFAGEEDLLEATRAAREQGLNIIDVYTPYAVHGLDKALGLRPSRLSRDDPKRRRKPLSRGPGAEYRGGNRSVECRWAARAPRRR